MSSRVKHAQRSHKSYTDNRAIFSKFQQYSFGVEQAKELKRAVKLNTFVDRMKSLFSRKPRKES